MNQQPKRIILILAFVAIYFVWGTTYLANIFVLKGMSPFVLSTLRYVLAAVGFLGWCWIKRISLPGKKDRKVLAISGILMLVGGSGFVVMGEQYINSGHTAVVIATEPLLFLLMDPGSRRSCRNPRILTGILLGFAGIFFFTWYTPVAAGQNSAPEHLLKGTVLVLVSTLFWVGGALYGRKAGKDVSPVAGAAVRHVAAAIVCALVALVHGDWSSFQPAQVPAEAWGGLAFLVVMGSLVAYLAFTWLVTVMPPAIVSTHTYVNPIVAVVIGWVMAGEAINSLQVTSLLMVLAGVLLANASGMKFSFPRLRRGTVRTSRGFPGIE